MVDSLIILKLNISILADIDNDVLDIPILVDINNGYYNKILVLFLIRFIKQDY